MHTAAEQREQSEKVREPDIDRAGVRGRSSQTKKLLGISNLPTFRRRRFQFDIRKRISRAFVEELEFGHLFLLYPVFLVAGALWWFSQPEAPSPLKLSAWLVVILPLLWMTREKSAPVCCGVRLVFCFVLGAFLSWGQTAQVHTVILDGPVRTNVVGKILQAEALSTDQWRYRVRILQTSTPHLRRPPDTALITVRSHHAGFEPGETIEGRAQLSPPSGPAMPGLNDFAFSSFFKDNGAIGFFYGSPRKVQSGNDEARYGIGHVETAIASIRAVISQRILNVLPGDPGAFAAAIITNNRSALSKQAIDALRQSGLAHIIAISGLHMALAAGLFFVGLRYIFSLFPELAQKRPAKKVAAVGALVSGGMYFLISGGPISAERAFIMLAIMIGAVFVDRSVFSLRSVAVAACLVVTTSPSSVVGPSFQMSFAAAAALISGYSLWRLKPSSAGHLEGFPPYKFIAPVARIVGGILLTSAIGGFSTAIFAAAHFQRLALYGLAANLAAMPIISLAIMPAGLVAMLLMPFGLDWLPLWIMGKGLEITLLIASHVSTWGSDLEVGQLAVWVLPAASVAFILTVLPRSALFRYSGAALFIAVLFAALIWGKAPRPDLLVFESGSIAAFLDGDALSFNRRRPAKFVADQWDRALAANGARYKPLVQKSILPKRTFGSPLSDAEVWKTEDKMEEAAKTIPPLRFFCSGKDWCLGKFTDGQVVITFADPAFKDPACRQSDFAVTSARFQKPDCNWYGARLFDQTILRRRGSLAFTIKHSSETQPVQNKTQITITGAMDGLNRVWNRHRYYDWRTGKFANPSIVAINDNGG